MTKTITPEKELQVIEKEVVPFVGKINEKFVIANPKQMKEASEIRVQLKAYEKQIKEKRESASKPAYAAYKAIMNMFNPLESKVKETLAIISNEMSRYQEEQDAIAEAAKQKIENRIGEGKGYLKPETAIEKMDAITEPASVISSESGNTMFINKPDCEVEDISKVPLEYLVPDMVKIREAMKGGTKIEGVRYFIRKVPRNG